MKILSHVKFDLTVLPLLGFAAGGNVYLMLRVLLCCPPPIVEDICTYMWIIEIIGYRVIDFT